MAGRSAAPRVTALVVVVDRALAIEACLESLRAQDEPAWEAVVVLNRATDAVAARVRAVAARDPRIRWLECPGLPASLARNQGLLAASSPLLYFLDDDVELPRDALRRVCELMEARPSVSIAGGPNLTPPDDPWFGQVSGELLGTWFGTGVARARYRAAPERPARERHLTLCNLVVRRSVFAQGLEFPAIFGGEENVLMGRASAAGHRLWYSPDLWVWHRRRTTLGGFLEQMRRYGFGRGIALCGAPGTFHPAHFVPLAFLLYLTLLPALLLATPWSLAPLAAHGALSTGTALLVALRRRSLGHLAGAPLFGALHVAYAVGLVQGLLRGRRSCPAERTPPSVRST